MSEMLGIDFMQRALLAAFLVGLAAPLVGVFLVQRRLALIGDGMGHVALAGVAVGVCCVRQEIASRACIFANRDGLIAVDGGVVDRNDGDRGNDLVRDRSGVIGDVQLYRPIARRWVLPGMLIGEAGQEGFDVGNRG